MHEGISENQYKQFHAIRDVATAVAVRTNATVRRDKPRQRRSRVTSRSDMLLPPGRDTITRRRFLTASAGVAGAAAAGRASADTLADVPPREIGVPLSGHSKRSKYVQLSRILEAGPGVRHVDPSDAINSKTPLDKLMGVITPWDLHYERSHSGALDLDPAKHRLLIHGLVKRPLVLTVDNLMAMPSVSRVHFIECTSNGWENWKKADESLTVQNTHGLVSTSEWTGVPLGFLIDLVGADRGSTWILAEGGDGAGVDRSLPLTDEIMNEAIVAYGQNGEPLRPAHGFPIRLVMPGFEGNHLCGCRLHLEFERNLAGGFEARQEHLAEDQDAQS
jgi:sulfane dehydrogenase subunit SoxC